MPRPTTPFDGEAVFTINYGDKKLLAKGTITSLTIKHRNNSMAASRLVSGKMLNMSTKAEAEIIVDEYIHDHNNDPELAKYSVEELLSAANKKLEQEGE